MLLASKLQELCCVQSRYVPQGNQLEVASSSNLGAPAIIPRQISSSWQTSAIWQGFQQMGMQVGCGWRCTLGGWCLVIGTWKCLPHESRSTHCMDISWSSFLPWRGNCGWHFSRLHQSRRKLLLWFVHAWCQPQKASPWLEPEYCGHIQTTFIHQPLWCFHSSKSSTDFFLCWTFSEVTDLATELVLGRSPPWGHRPYQGKDDENSSVEGWKGCGYVGYWVSMQHACEIGCHYHPSWAF